MTIKELRAIAHGAGQDTRGMERADLESIAAQMAPASARYPAPMPPTQPQPQPQPPQAHTNMPRSGSTTSATEDAEQEIRKKRAETAKQNNEDILQRIKEQAAAKAVAEMEQKRQKEEEELKMRSDFAKEWSGKVNQDDATNKSFNSERFGKTSLPNANAPYPQQNPPVSPTRAVTPPAQRHQVPQTGDPTSPINHKYAKAVQSERKEDEATISAIKRNILIHWALMPPKYNMLRPIDHLLCSIHTVFPPAFGVAQHSYFTRWRQITPADLVMSTAMGNSPDENKLKKAVRKLRVHLHPDRLPRDFNAEHTFICKMLWDVSNDAWEEFLKHKDDLDWIHK